MRPKTWAATPAAASAFAITCPVPGCLQPVRCDSCARLMQGFACFNRRGHTGSECAGQPENSGGTGLPLADRATGNDGQWFGRSPRIRSPGVSCSPRSFSVSDCVTASVVTAARPRRPSTLPPRAFLFNRFDENWSSAPSPGRSFHCVSPNRQVWADLATTIRRARTGPHPANCARLLCRHNLRLHHGLLPIEAAVRISVRLSDDNVPGTGERRDRAPFAIAWPFTLHDPWRCAGRRICPPAGPGPVLSRRLVGVA